MRALYGKGSTLPEVIDHPVQFFLLENNEGLYDLYVSTSVGGELTWKQVKSGADLAGGRPYTNLNIYDASYTIDLDVNPEYYGSTISIVNGVYGEIQIALELGTFDIANLGRTIYIHNQPTAGHYIKIRMPDPAITIRRSGEVVSGSAMFLAIGPSETAALTLEQADNGDVYWQHHLNGYIDMDG